MVGGLATKTTGIVLETELSVDIEPDALTLYDLSRYKNNGAMLGAGEPDAVRLPSGLWVWKYDGLNDLITIPNDPSWNKLAQFTILIWINLVAYPTGVRSGIIYASDGFEADGFGLVWLSGTTFRWYKDTTSAIGTGNTPLDTWLCLALTYDGSFLQPYNNGQAVDAPVAEGSAMDITNVMRLGMNRLRNTYTNVIIGYFTIHSYAQSAGKILQRFEATRRLFGV